jgi:RHS repeat-associated protein
MSCFERDSYGYPTTGSLLRKRVYKIGATAGGDDVVVAFGYDSERGDLISEQYYGGDGAGLGTSGLCSLSLPSAPTYTLANSYRFGSLERRSYVNVSEPGTTLDVVNNTISDGGEDGDSGIDQHTGLVKSSRDAAGLRADFSYDALGRLTAVQPTQGAWTRYAYTPGTSAAPAQVGASLSSNGLTTGDLGQQRYEYDPWGRLAGEFARLPATSCTSSPCWNQRLTTYNAMGWTASVSELQPFGTSGAAIKVTQFEDFDPFGRARTIRPPDTTPSLNHNVTVQYESVRTMARTVRFGTTLDPVSGVVSETPSETKEEYDGLGRLHSVQEYSSTPETPLTTTYGYDVGGRLHSVYTEVTPGVSQTRTFVYDDRGFLASETLPEIGPWGNGTRTYSEYDARGHVGRTVDGPNTLTYAYDGAERLLEVSIPGVVPASNGLLKEFTYDEIDGVPRGYSKGKLVRATRHNRYLPADLSADFPVTELYTYDGLAGHASSRTTTLSTLGECQQGFTWNDLGAPASVIYPTCTGAAGTARTLTLGYSHGLLTSVADQDRTYASSISYHPNTMLKSVAHGNGVTVTHGLDSHAMRRPGSIATSGVTGTPGNWDSGAYAYDGAGNITRIGEEWYTYDLVSRLAAHRTGPDSQCQGNNQSGYLYDPLGNMEMGYFLCGAGEGWGYYWPDPSTNRLAMQSYDASGNTLETAGAANFETLAYYPFNDLRSAVGTGLNRLYGYTADGERLVDYDAQPNPPAGPFTITLRDLGGKVLRSFETTTGSPATWTEKEDWIYRDGQLLATVDTTVQGGVARHVHLDHLGTPRLITSASGVGLETHTYLPFGLEVTEVGPLFERMKFTGHERDLTSGLDYMHARYYSQYVNRFLSPDPVRGDPRRPQTWNAYTYALNNPMRFTDPTGLWWDEWMSQWVNGKHEPESTLGGLGLSDVPGIYCDYLDGMAMTVAMPGLRVMSGLINDDPRQVAIGTGEIVVAGFAGGAANYLLGSATGAAGGVANPLPRTMARVIPEGIPAKTLGRPGAADVMVTAADDIAGMNAAQIAERLTIPESPFGFRVVGFPTPEAGVASLVFRSNPGFVGGGRTAGGAREFVVPNQLIPAGARIRVVRP